MRAIDRRTIRTRQWLRDSLLALIVEKGYEDITVQDITERADLRRATFYLHYRNKEDLLLTTLQVMFDALVSEIEPTMRGDLLAGKSQIASFLVTFRHVEQNAALYRILLNSPGAVVVTKRIRDYIVGQIHRTLRAVPPQTLPMPPDILAHYVAGVELTLIAWWLENERPYSVEQMAEYTQRLVLDGAMGVLNSVTIKN
ncbi:MAG: TetR/AcrR family transcriptional regulator [Burkholderiales bacterium]|nr:TetR/AcrR family transcriptional regulator [Anaerolineae bacterium]